MILPSKKILSLFVLAVGIVAAIIIAFGKETTGSAIDRVGNLVAGEKINVPENPDWQLELGTISENIAPIELADTTTTSTMTDDVSRTLMSNYLALKQGGTLTNTSAQNLVESTLSYVGQLDINSIPNQDLLVIPDSGTQSMRDYGEILGLVLKANKPRTPRNEITIIEEAIAQKDPEKLKELEDIATTYKHIAEELAVMPVPQKFTKAHLDMIDGANGMSKGLREIAQVLGDPFRGLAGIQIYQQSGIAFMQAKQATAAYLAQNGIVYKQGSGGYYLMYGI